MAKKKLDKDMINGVSGGEIGENSQGEFEVLDKNGKNIFKDERTFPSAYKAANVALAVGENTIYLTREERFRRSALVGDVINEEEERKMRELNTGVSYL